MKVGDFVVAIDGVAIQSVEELPRVAMNKAAGAPITVDLLREGQTPTVQFVPMMIERTQTFTLAPAIPKLRALGR